MEDNSGYQKWKKKNPGNAGREVHTMKLLRSNVESGLNCGQGPDFIIFYSWHFEFSFSPSHSIYEWTYRF